jgi:FtsH-binding integral membrane protein
MTIESLLLIYFIVTVTVLFTTALFIFTTGEDIPEIDNFYDWLFYGIFWILIVIKYMIKFFIKLVKT